MKQIKYVTALILAGVMFNADCGGSENNLESDNSKWSQVSTDGGSFTTALQQDGTLWGWGFDEGSFFGLGENGPYQVWTPMKLSKDTDWIKVSGDYIIKANGTLWTWDRNRFYQLNYDTDWVDIIRGFNHTIALKKNGTLWAWGENGLGELGLGDNTDRFLFAQYRQVGCDTDWTRVAAGNRCTLAIKANGTMWGWGGIWGNKLKDSSGMISNIPIQIGTESNWTKIACGINCFNAAIKKDGTLWTWGDNIKGQLGLGDTIDRIEPTQVGTDKDWLDVSAHGSMIALKSDGTLWSWGGNHVGQLGIGTIDEKPHPLPLRVGKDNDWKTVGGDNFAIKKDGTLWAWGYNYNGDLGLGKKEKISTPTQVKIMSDPKPAYLKKK